MPIKVFHTGRRTTTGDQVADDLSKGKVALVEKNMPEGVDVTARVSKVLLDWLRNPRVSIALGRRVLEELARTTRAEVLVGLDYELAVLELEAEVADKDATK